MSKAFSLKARLRSFRYALLGIQHLLRHEHNFRIHLAAAGLVVTAGFYFKVDRTEWLWLIMSMGMVMMAEAFNSALERLVDLKHPEKAAKAGLIKDIAAGAVLLMAITAAIIGGLIFWPYLESL